MCYEILLLMSYISAAACVMAPTHLLVTRAGPCYDEKTNPITVSELSLITRPNVSLLSGEFKVSEEIENGWEVKATMQKCVDIRNVESCDFFRSFYVVKDGCSDEEMEQDSYSNTLFNYTHPRLQCPISSGHYKLVHYPIFTEDNYLVAPESKISTSIFGYTFRLDGLTEKSRKIFCIEALLQLMYARKHDWAANTHVPEASPPPLSGKSSNMDKKRKKGMKLNSLI